MDQISGYSTDELLAELQAWAEEETLAQPPGKRAGLYLKFAPGGWRATASTYRVDAAYGYGTGGSPIEALRECLTVLRGGERRHLAPDSGIGGVTIHEYRNGKVCVVFAAKPPIVVVTALKAAKFKFVYGKWIGPYISAVPDELYAYRLANAKLEGRQKAADLSEVDVETGEILDESDGEAGS